MKPYRIRQAFVMGGVNIRKVEYSPGYKADHWCSKGHFNLCLEGETDTELMTAVS